MSDGQPDRPAHPYEKIKFDRATLTSKLALRTGDIQDAAGDVRAAEERMREAIIKAQKDVEDRQGALAERKEHALGGLKELGLTNRAIEFTSGRTLAAVDFSDPEKPYLAPGSEGEDLAGSGGTITDVELGTFLGQPIHPPESMVLFIDMDDARGDLKYAGLADYSYAVVVNHAEFNTGEIPREEVS